jgi:hypothetical protein
MPPQAMSSATADAPVRPACPHCNGAVNRVPRRLMDHLVSALVPVRRYSCRTLACHWEGTLRDECFDLLPADNAKRYNRRFNSY